MVQFNLLPEVKIEFIKAQRSKHGLTVIAFVVAAICLGVLIVAFFIANIVQKQYVKSLSGTITTLSQEVKGVEDINKILTVQNQLGKLTELHEHKPVTSRVFRYLTQVTPSDASLNKLVLDYSLKSLVVGGKATSLDTVRVFADTLKATKYQTPEGTEKNAFSEVVLTSFNTGDKGTDFTITMKFDPIIFEGKQDGLVLVVPASAGANKEDVFKEAN